ncbi:MAG: DUF1439 domain-containing protein [Pseudomonadota bacterium]
MTLFQNGRAWRRFTHGAALLACAMLASCAGLIGPREVEIPLYKLQDGIERRFPLNNRVLELLDIRLSRPQLFLPGGDRVALGMEVYVAPPFTNQSWSGSLALSGRLSLDAQRSAVVMNDARVDRFVIDGMDEARQRQLGKVANVLVGRVVRDVPVYTFRLEDLRYAGVQFVPTRITSTPRALLVTLEPQR